MEAKPQENSVKAETIQPKGFERAADGKQEQLQQALPQYPWVGYQAAVLDINGDIIQMVPIMQGEKKKEQGILAAFFSRFVFKKKLDIVKLVAERALSPNQLIQICSAIERGLTEKQLMVLINNNLPREQMEEIIQIAEYENRQRGAV